MHMKLPIGKQQQCWSYLARFKR